MGHFLDAITNAGREKYEFEASGRGCRSWTTDQIELFLSLGLITSAEEAQATKSNLLTEFVRGKSTNKKVPLSKGAYYA